MTKHDKQNATQKTKDWRKTGAQEGWSVPVPSEEPEPLQVRDTKMVINENRVGHQCTFCVINYRKYNYEAECDKGIIVILYSLFDSLLLLCILIYLQLVHLTTHVLNL
jgi:hypothetical protein